jgi:hypothetical protein
VNLETPDYTRSLPRSVRPAPDAGTYFVRSQSRPMEHVVDVHLLQCTCESATKGAARQDAIRNGGGPSFRWMCPHLRRALLAHALLVLETRRRKEVAA